MMISVNVSDLFEQPIKSVKMRVVVKSVKTGLIVSRFDLIFCMLGSFGCFVVNLFALLTKLLSIFFTKKGFSRIVLLLNPLNGLQLIYTPRNIGNNFIINCTKIIIPFITKAIFTFFPSVTTTTTSMQIPYFSFKR